MKREELFSFVSELGESVLFFDQVPLALRKDFNSFMFGKTVGMKDSSPYAFKPDVSMWKSKLINHGIDYPIQLYT